MTDAYAANVMAFRASVAAALTTYQPPSRKTSGLHDVTSHDHRCPVPIHQSENYDFEFGAEMNENVMIGVSEGVK
jgi:hypothetical protein